LQKGPWVAGAALQEVSSKGGVSRVYL
jgi:hypothetical protein